MEQTRPDPDALLAQVKAEEVAEARGKLKVFFGATAGVGKTYAMLSAARVRAVEGVDLVVGYAEPHARPETEELLLGLDLLPPKVIDYHGAALKEFDLDAALKRRPELIIVDELAHTNAPGLRHVKRWQDVEELLQAGIDVYTTLNVQHLESLNDVVAQITGVIVRETLPDVVFDRADEVELVDLPPEELLERLHEGKVYVPAQAEQAVQRFFRKPNLIALRELALRKVTQRVSQDVQLARREQAGTKTWASSERLMVCISPSPASAKTIRAAKRLAVALDAPWIAAYVETPKFKDLIQQQKTELLHNFRLAERLGAETANLSGLNAADEIVSYARQRNVTKIVAGKSDRRWWRDPLRQSTTDQLLRKSGDIDVYVVRGGRSESDDPGVSDAGPSAAPTWHTYLYALSGVLAATLVCLGMYYLFKLEQHGDLSNLIMVYLVGVAVVAARYGRGPAVVAAALSVLAFDLFFVKPYFHVTAADSQYFVTFAVMLAIALLIGTMTARLREQAQAARQREQHTRALYRMGQDLAGRSDLSELVAAIVGQIADVLHCQVRLLLPQEDGRLGVRWPAAAESVRGEAELAVAQWVFEHRQLAGRGTDTLPAAECLYVPLVGSRGVVGVLGLRAAHPDQLLAPEPRQLLEAFASQAALAIERDRLGQQARQAQVQAETEKLRASLLSSVSHDLRTPLAVITGASSTLLDDSARDHATRRELLQTIRDESQRLTRLVSNLLDMTRLQTGAVTLSRQWQPLEEIVGSALTRLEGQLGDRPLRTALPADLPMVHVDGVLIEQVLINLLENALKYTPPDSPIEISGGSREGAVMVAVADHGPGLAAGEERRVFEKFYRGSAGLQGRERGVGLGLPICRAIIETHGGRIWAENRAAPEHGAVFRFTLPLEGTPPRIDEAVANRLAPQPDAETQPQMKDE